MRKLKALLVLMFAACLSLALFACGGGEEEAGKKLNLVRPGTQINLTDADEEEDFNKKMESYTIVGRNEDGDVNILGKDCEITGEEILYHTVGRYTITLKPKENNPDGRSNTAIVVIDHAWEAVEGQEGKEVCTYDQATRETKDEDIAIHYGTFHDGTANTNSTAINAAALNEANAADLGLHAETPNGKVFNNDAGINVIDDTDVKSSSRIKEFGKDARNGKTVPSLTAGDLTPGMSITIEGYVKTDTYAEGGDATTSPWGQVNEFWNIASYGIADPYDTLSQLDNAGRYEGGSSVIVRSEGWVLYNGIGKTLATNVLGGVPAFVQNGASRSGIDATANYGSHTDASPNGEWTWPTGYNSSQRPAYTDSAWLDWWVYSEGTTHQSGNDYYFDSYTQVRVTWTYHTYKLDPSNPNSEEVGIIEIASEDLTQGTALYAYIKVPTPTRGAYRTIIHGDFSTLLITKSVYVETETISDVKVSDTLQNNAVTEYLAGEQIDAGNVFKLEIKSEQNSAWHDSGISVANDMLYYYAPADQEDNTWAKAYAAVDEPTDTDTDDPETAAAAVWKQVGDNPLTTEMKYFKVVVDRGDGYNCMVPEGIEIKVQPNNVAGAVFDNYDDDYDSRDPMAKYDVVLGKEKSGDTTTYYTDLTIDKAIFRALPGDATEIFENFTDTEGEYRYATIRILGAEAFDTLSADVSGEVTVSGVGTYYFAFKADGNDVLLAVAITEDLLGEALTIEGIQETDVRVVFGENSVGFGGVTSEATYTAPALNAGGTVTITYKNLQAQTQAWIQTPTGNVEVASLRNAEKDEDEETVLATPAQLGTSGIFVTAFAETETETEITFEFPAFDIVNWTAMPYIRAVSRRTGGDILAEDYVEYDVGAAIAADSGVTKSEEDVFFTESNGVLYFATATAVAEEGDSVDLSTVSNNALTVNINNGKQENAKSFNLAYKYSDIALAFTDENLGDAVTLNTILLRKAYGDYGVIVVAAIDVSAATGIDIANGYGFQIGGADAAHYWKYDATDGITYVDDFTAGAKTVLKEGNCFETGIVASQVKDGDDVVFLADYTVVGGEHVSDGHGHCKLCGGTLETAKLPAWTAVKEFTNVQPGTVIDMTGTFADTVTAQDSNCGPVVSVYDAENTHYWLRTDGLFIAFPKDVWWNVESNQGPANAEANVDNANEDMTTTLPYNTLNGVVTLTGETLDSAKLGTFYAGKNFRYIVTYGDDGVMKFDVYIYDGTTLVLNYYVTMKPSGTTRVAFTQQPDNNVSGNPTFVRSALHKSVISGISTDAVEDVPEHSDYAPSTGIDGEIEGSTIALSGAATKLDAATADVTHYVAFKINFSQALDASTTAVVKDADGEVVSAAYAVMLSDYNAMVVYIPLKAGEAYTTFTVDLTNFVAATLQSDITIDIRNVAVSNITATLAGAEGMGLAADEFTITYAVEGETLPASATLVVNDGTGVALSAITDSDTTLKDGLSVKKTAGAAGSATITLTFTKAAADLSKEIPAYTINLMDGESVIANTMIAAPITIGTYGTQINTDSKWYAKAEGTVLYLFTDTNKNPGTLPLNVNAGYTTLGADDAGIEKLRISDLGYSYADGKFTFRDTKVTNVTGAYTAVGSAFLAALKIDLTSLNIAADTEYGFAIETEGAGCYTVAADRQITSSSAPDHEIVLRAATCTVEGVTAYGADDDKTQCTYFGLIERTLGEHNFSQDADNKNGYDEAKVCSACGAVKYSQNSDTTPITQSWGEGTGVAWDKGNTWETFGTLYKGGYYKITGTTASGQTNLWDFNEPGLTDVSGTNADGFRADNYVQNDNTTLPWTWVDGTGPINATYAFKDAKNPSFSYSFGALETAIKTHLNGATMTYTFDYTDASKIVITMQLVNGDDMDFTVTVTLTSPDPLLDTYYLAFHADRSVFTASSVETLVPSGKTAPAALSKHVHNWDTSDKCECGEIHPEHGTNDQHPHVPDTAGAHCTICGAVVEHDHQMQDDVCTLCGARNITADGYTGVAEVVEGFKNNDTDDGVWGNGTTEFSIADNCAIVLTWTQGKVEGHGGSTNTPGQAVLEFRWTDTEYHCVDHANMRYNGINPDAWVFNADNAQNPITLPQLTRTVTKNGQEDTLPAEVAGAYTGDYVTVITRVGAKLHIVATFTDSNGNKYVVDDTYDAFFTGKQMTFAVVMNPFACENLTAYYCELTQGD